MIEALIALAKDREPRNPSREWIKSKLVEEAEEFRILSEEVDDNYLDELGDVLLCALMLYAGLDEEQQVKVVKFAWAKSLSREAFGKEKVAEGIFRRKLATSEGDRNRKL